MYGWVNGDRENLRACPPRAGQACHFFFGTRAIGYATFANWIGHARAFLAGQGLRSGSTAVLDINCLIDTWVFGFALRSLGITTISVPALHWLERLHLNDIGCIVSAASEQHPALKQVRNEYKYIRIPPQHYLGMGAEDFPAMPVVSPAAGHILLTSGTTGTSKKILIDHEHLARIVPRRAAVYGISERSIVNVFAFATSSGTAYKVPNCVWSLGGTVVIYQEPSQHEALRVEGITSAHFTPGSLSEILQAPPNEIVRSESMHAYVAGGALPRALAAEAMARLTPHIFVTVASTEVGPWALTRIEREEDLRSHCIHPTAEVQVVDETGRPLPAGRTGAIRIRTPDMAAKYLDDDAASCTNFRDGYFYSGDLGAFEANGRLVLQGRANNVLNVLGRKVGAEVMELAIQERLAAEGVCILSQEGDGMDPRFHIAIEARRTIAQAELASAISPWLPGIPQFQVYFVNPLPRTNTGKIDRMAVKRRLMGEQGNDPHIEGGRRGE